MKLTNLLLVIAALAVVGAAYYLNSRTPTASTEVAEPEGSTLTRVHVSPTPVDFESKYANWSIQRLQAHSDLLLRELREETDASLKDRMGSGLYEEAVAKGLTQAEMAEALATPLRAGYSTPVMTSSEAAGPDLVRTMTVVHLPDEYPELKRKREEIGWLAGRVHQLEVAAKED
jgi:hypothetical protein